MNTIQLAIIAFVVFIILFTIGYYWYQENKFRKLVEHNFNQKTDDTINKNKPLILDAFSNNVKTTKEDSKFMQKDTVFKPDELSFDPLFGDDEARAIHEEQTVDSIPTNEQSIDITNDPIEEIPNDSREAFFAKLDLIPFPFTNEVDPNLDLVFDIVFEEAQKIKTLPEINQYAQKSYCAYVLDAKNNWVRFETRGKYTANALKIKIELVDKEGVMSDASVENIYNQLYPFVLHHSAHIRTSDYKKSINYIHNYLANLDKIELVLQLYLILKDNIAYNELNSFLNSSGLVYEDGYYLSKDGADINFVVANENDEGLREGNTYNMLSINTSLHFHKNPKHAVDAIFDFAEKFMSSFDSRLLTVNKQIFNERDYETLDRHINNYLNNIKKCGINAGSELIYRLF